MDLKQHSHGETEDGLWKYLRIKVPFQFDKSAYLLILMLISVNFFHFSPISSFTGNDPCLVLFLLWLLAAHFLYNPPEKYLTFALKKYYWPMAAIWLGVLISFVPAYVLYGQSPIWSLIASRVMLALFALPAIGVVNPQRIELERAVTVFSVILIAFSILDALGVPVIDRNYFIGFISEDRPEQKLIDEDSFVMLLPGFQFVAVTLFFCLDRLKANFCVRDLLWSLFFMAAIFLIQNRTMLFISALLFAYTFLSIRGSTSRQTFIFRGSAVLLILVAVYVTIPQWGKLFSETASQLGNSDYNRILAYDYFLFRACPSPIYYFTGTGFISANANPVMQDLMKAGIYNSDVGFVGLWNYYGVLPLVAILLTVIHGLSKKAPSYVRFNAIFILIGGLTIACFDTMDKIVWLCLFIFLVNCKP